MEFAVAVIAGLLGAFAGFVVQVFVSVRSSELQSISDQIEDLKRIEEYGVAYWLTDPSEKQECRKYAAKLRGALAASAAFEEQGPKILGFRFERYADLVLKLDRVATGGQFESNRKDIEPERAAACIRTVGELVAHLRMCRRFVFLWR